MISKNRYHVCQREYIFEPTCSLNTIDKLFAEITDIVREHQVDGFSLKHLREGIDRASVVGYSVDDRGCANAFSLYEVLQSFRSLQGGQIVYRSATFVRQDTKRNGLAGGLLRASLAHFEPHIICSSTSSIIWRNANRKLLSEYSYSCYPSNDSATPQNVYKIAQEVLRRTGRDCSSLTRNLVRIGLYRSSLKKKVPSVRHEPSNGTLAPGDAWMLVAIKEEERS